MAQGPGSWYTAEAVAAFSETFSNWASALDPALQAMLIDLLAKAGGDVRGTDDEAQTNREGDDPTSDTLSPLEMRDWATAARGVLDLNTEPRNTEPSVRAE